jgi:SAM-dependent methyltransferase
MANFLPLKQHMFYCLERFIERYGMRGPFLEVGCGAGDVSEHLARKGWHGLAIDASPAAVERARVRLDRYADVTLERRELADVRGRFASVLMWDVLEHIDDDDAALRAVAALLEPGGHLLLAVPSNPREWRWDDDFYGHFRRYTTEGIGTKLATAGLEPVVSWDFTFPWFWAMRRVYTRVKRPPAMASSKRDATMDSALHSAWEAGALSKVLDRTAPLWAPLHRIQFALFRNATRQGHEMFVLARKPA